MRWTRLAPEPMAGGGLPMRAVEVGYEVASDDRFRTIVRRGTALARPEPGHSVHVEVSGLEPGRQYWYRFRVGAELGATGRAKTAPAEGATPEAVRFATAGCQRHAEGHFTAYGHLAAEELDFVFHYGDTSTSIAPAAAPTVRCARSSATKSTPSSITATAMRCTSRMPILRPRTPPTPS